MAKIKTDRLCPKCKKAYLYRCTGMDEDAGGNTFEDVWYECDKCDEMFWWYDLQKLEKPLCEKCGLKLAKLGFTCCEDCFPKNL